MKPWARSALIFFAYSIALLHTAVPHSHGQSRGGEYVISQAGCIFTESGSGLLQKVLSTDLGIGHLEIFKKGGEADIKFATALILIITMVALGVALRGPVKKASEFSLGYIEKLKRKLLLFCVSHLRAPPVC